MELIDLEKILTSGLKEYEAMNYTISGKLDGVVTLKITLREKVRETAEDIITRIHI